MELGWSSEEREPGLAVHDVARSFRNLATGGNALVVPAFGWHDVTASVERSQGGACTVAASTHVVRELRQPCGSIGLTEEHELHRATTRIVTLCSELGGAHTRRRALTRHRWPNDVTTNKFPQGRDT